jgi:hypothetical protein
VSDIDVVHETGAQRFRAEVDGLQSTLAYTRIGPTQPGAGVTLDLYSTFVPPELRGRGLAGDLARHALEFAAAEGFKVIPSCPFIRRYLDAHPQYARLVVQD